MCWDSSSSSIFQSTLSVRRATFRTRPMIRRALFQSTLSVRRATRSEIMSPDSLIFQSTLSVRRATRHLALAPLVLRISIHALRKESDKAIRSRMALWLFQSTLSVRRATVKDHPMRWLLLFQSTLSVRRATILLAAVVDVMLFQSTLSVRRATRQVDHAAIAHDISIHALRKESDRRAVGRWRARRDFNPRSP